MNVLEPPGVSKAGRLTFDEHQRSFLDALSRRYRGALTAFFRRRAPNWRQDSEDLTQEVFLRLARREGEGGIERAEQYLFQIARSVLVDNARRHIVRNTVCHETYDELEHAVEDFSPERVLDGKEQIALVLSALDNLPDNVRAAFVLHRFEELTYVEIAVRLGVSVSSIEKYMIRALKTMTALVKEGT